MRIHDEMLAAAGFRLQSRRRRTISRTAMSASTPSSNNHAPCPITLRRKLFFFGSCRQRRPKQELDHVLPSPRLRQSCLHRGCHRTWRASFRQLYLEVRPVSHIEQFIVQSNLTCVQSIPLLLQCRSPLFFITSLNYGPGLRQGTFLF